MKLNKILKLERIRIAKIVSGLMKFGIVDLSDIEKPREFYNTDYPVENLLTDYTFAKINYRVYKDNLPLFSKDLTKKRTNRIF